MKNRSNKPEAEGVAAALPARSLSSRYVGWRQLPLSGGADGDHPLLFFSSDIK
jgi:hypothetical protein